MNYKNVILCPEFQSWFVCKGVYIFIDLNMERGMAILAVRGVDSCCWQRMVSILNCLKVLLILINQLAEGIKQGFMVDVIETEKKEEFLKAAA